MQAVTSGAVTQVRAVTLRDRCEHARRALSLFQHHDGVTGTSRDDVREDYARKMLQAIKYSQSAIQQAAYHLLGEPQVREQTQEDIYFDVDDIWRRHDEIPARFVSTYYLCQHAAFVKMLLVSECVKYSQSVIHQAAYHLLGEPQVREQTQEDIYFDVDDIWRRHDEIPARLVSECVKYSQSVIHQAAYHLLGEPQVREQTQEDIYFDVDDIWRRHDEIPARLLLVSECVKYRQCLIQQAAYHLLGEPQVREQTQEDIYFDVDDIWKRHDEIPARFVSQCVKYSQSAIQQAAYHLLGEPQVREQTQEDIYFDVDDIWRRHDEIPARLVSECVKYSQSVIHQAAYHLLGEPQVREQTQEDIYFDVDDIWRRHDEIPARLLLVSECVKYRQCLIQQAAYHLLGEPQVREQTQEDIYFDVDDIWKRHDEIPARFVSQCVKYSQSAIQQAAYHLLGEPQVREQTQEDIYFDVDDIWKRHDEIPARFVSQCVKYSQSAIQQAAYHLLGEPQVREQTQEDIYFDVDDIWKRHDEIPARFVSQCVKYSQSAIQQAAYHLLGEPQVREQTQEDIYFDVDDIWRRHDEIPARFVSQCVKYSQSAIQQAAYHLLGEPQVREQTQEDIYFDVDDIWRRHDEIPARFVSQCVKYSQSAIQQAAYHLLGEPQVREQTQEDIYFDVDDIWRRHDEIPARITIALDVVSPSRKIVLYNALTFARTEITTVIVNTPHVEVFDPSGSPMMGQISPVVTSEHRLGFAPNKYELSFPATVQPLALTTYTVALRDNMTINKCIWSTEKYGSPFGVMMCVSPFRRMMGQISPVVTSEHRLGFAPNKYELSFPATVQPLALTTYTVALRDNMTINKYTSYSRVRIYNTDFWSFDLPKMFAVDMPTTKLDEDVTLSAGNGTRVICTKTGMIKAVTLPDGGNFPLAMDFVQYDTEKEQDGNSGAYLFIPSGPAEPVKLDAFPDMVITEGMYKASLYTSLESAKTVELALTVSVYNNPSLPQAEVHVSNTLLIDPAVDDIELAMRLATRVANQDTFYTDLNGMQMIKRRYFEKLPLQANFYPLPAATYIQDETHRLNVLTSTPLGMAALQPGEIQIMQDRRLSRDDNRGLNQGVMDNVRTRHHFKIIIETANKPCQKPPHPSHPSGQLSLGAHIAAQTLLQPLVVMQYSAARDAGPETNRMKSPRSAADIILAEARSHTHAKNSLDKSMQGVGMTFQRVYLDPCYGNKEIYNTYPVSDGQVELREYVNVSASQVYPSTLTFTRVRAPATQTVLDVCPMEVTSVFLHVAMPRSNS
ncbi:alpha mannosidase middle domain-containing protein [Phthorimaea operculella]|nr:alpha mannosidase middle domain-containing protein [Phthorimaea operculella]